MVLPFLLCLAVRVVLFFVELHELG